MNTETDAEGAATQGLAELLHEVGFGAEKAKRIAEWIASFGEKEWYED